MFLGCAGRLGYKLFQAAISSYTISNIDSHIILANHVQGKKKNQDSPLSLYIIYMYIFICFQSSQLYSVISLCRQFTYICQYEDIWKYNAVYILICNILGYVHARFFWIVCFIVMLQMFLAVYVYIYIHQILIAHAHTHMCIYIYVSSNSQKHIYWGLLRLFIMFAICLLITSKVIKK